MIDSIIQNTMRKAIHRFAENSNSRPQEHQILIAFDTEKQMPKYKHLVANGATHDIDFNKDILNVRFDMLQREEIVSSFITKKFFVFAKEFNESPERIFVILKVQEQDEDEIDLLLFKGSEFKRKIDLLQLIV